MTAYSQAPLDGELAWAISSWPGTEGSDLSHSEVESLTRHLTAEGFAKPAPASGDLSLGDLRKLAAQARRSLGDFVKDFGVADSASGRQPADR